MNEYGPLANLVAVAGSIMAAGGAISLAWRGRASWEPSQEDLPRGPTKVAALLSSVIIVVLWAFQETLYQSSWLLSIIWTGLILTVLGLFTYVFLIRVYVYTCEVAIDERRVVEKKVIAGFILTEGARKAQTENPGVDLQSLFKGSGYRKDWVWTKHSQGLAEVCFIAAYMTLIVPGSITLASAALLLSRAMPFSPAG